MRLWAWLNKIWPSYAYIPTIVIFLMNCITYTGTKFITANMYHYDIASSLDASLPFIPWFVIFYVLAYAQWGWNYFFHARAGREEFYHIIITDLMAKVICFIIFILFPTIMVRPALTGSGIWYFGLRIIYWIDAPTNLFPSIHCLASWLCFRASLLMKKMPKWYPALQFIITILVFASTVFIKQHMLIDIIGGVLIVEICWFVSRRLSLWRVVRFLETPSIRLKYSQEGGDSI